MVGVIGKIKMTRDWFGRICVVLFCVSWVFAEAVRQSPPCFPYVDFLAVTLTDRLGPEILTVLERKGQVLHRVRLHVKVPG